MNDRVYICLLKDGESRTVLQPFIAYDDNTALQTVKNAIREDESIRAIAMQERISLHTLCDIIAEEDDFFVQPHDLEEYIGDNEYFRRYAQSVLADEARQKANELEATDDD